MSSRRQFLKIGLLATVGATGVRSMAATAAGEKSLPAPIAQLKSMKSLATPISRRNVLSVSNEPAS
jgi:hypothetical protein